jgi:hypothetical protein
MSCALFASGGQGQQRLQPRMPRGWRKVANRLCRLVKSGKVPVLLSE